MKRFFEFVLLVVLFTSLFYACGCGKKSAVVENVYFTADENAVRYIAEEGVEWEFPAIAEINEETTNIYVVSSRRGRDFLAVVRDDNGEYVEIDFVLVRNNEGEMWAIYDKDEHPTYVGRGYILVGDDHRLRCIYKKESGDWREANFSKIHENGWVGPTMFSIL